MENSFLSEFKERDYFNQCTNSNELEQLMNKKKIRAYIGFDCTASSLHVGSLLQIMCLRLLQKHGHQPIVLLGGGTTRIGDPSGKEETRKILSEKEIEKNIKNIEKVFKIYLKTNNPKTKPIFVNNYKWLGKLNYIKFLREIGKHFTINKMLSFDSVKLRLDREQSLSYMEFNYMILQAYDFFELNKNKNCLMQMGGSDQWGNIVNGVELIKRHSSKQVFGLTTPLITLSSGSKMGKTEKGAVWLDKKLLSSYDYWQFWRNTDDRDVLRFIKMFTDLTLEKIEEIENKNINQLKIILANECTKMLHGNNEAKLAEETAKKTFEDRSTGSELPAVKIKQTQINQEIDIINLILLSKLESSKSEIRRIIKSNGVKINNATINDDKFLIKNNIKLINALKRLRDLGNTVIVVEHDTETMESADHIIDLGPKAGNDGGHIVAQGKLKAIMDSENSITGKYLSKKMNIHVPRTRKLAKNGRYLEILGATGFNLKNINLKIPLGTFTCVTGVSGSGKSTLIIHTLYDALNLMLNNNKSRKIPKAFKSYRGVERIDKIINIDQSPIGRTPRSNPATYTGAFGPIRDWFASLPESKARGYKVGRFSFNVKGGRCEACEGDGVITYEMHFLPDVYIACDVCKGLRYNRETLEIKYKNKNIADVLNMTVDEGCNFFVNIPTVKTKLLTLKKVGLGYIQIGQQATTLSGGEAQRIKLAKELSKRSTGRTMYILDEPTTGLHAHDIKKLLEILQTFVVQGNTVVVIEHNLDVIKTADWIIDMGPDGGINGGQIIAEGSPEKITEINGSYTGDFLKNIINSKLKKTA